MLRRPVDLTSDFLPTVIDSVLTAEAVMLMGSAVSRRTRLPYLVSTLSAVLPSSSATERLK